MKKTALVLSLLCLCGPASADPATTPELNAQLARIAAVMGRSADDWRSQEVRWLSSGMVGETYRLLDVSVEGYTLKSGPISREEMSALDKRLTALFDQSDWWRSVENEAEGPDGFLYAYRKQHMVCLTEGQWPHSNRSGRIIISCGIEP